LFQQKAIRTTGARRGTKYFAKQAAVSRSARIFLCAGYGMALPLGTFSQQDLRQQATDHRRLVHTSLPRGHRIAALLVVLAGDVLDHFGRAVYGEFILASVRGMPDTAGGRPASDLMQEVSRKGPQALPPGYGKGFAARVYKILISKFADPEIADEAMSHVLLQIARKKLHVASGASVQEGEALVITVAINAARDQLRRRNRLRERSLAPDEADQPIDIEDPNAFNQLDRLLPTSELMGVLRELERVHPRAPEWLRARLNGDSGTEIAQDWGTTPSYISKWQATYVPQIKKLIENHLRTAARHTSEVVAYSYDRRSPSDRRG
jgi:DNA-directed RNA polymerase specialized sigma24 family protein